MTGIGDLNMKNLWIWAISVSEQFKFHTQLS